MVESKDYTSPAEMRRLMDTAASNIDFAKELMRDARTSEEKKLAQRMLKDAQALWQSMENLMKSRRRGSV